MNEFIDLSNYLEKKETYIGNLYIYKGYKKIYQKIMKFATKINKSEISLEYIEKIKNINKKDNIYYRKMHFHSFDENNKFGKISSISSLSKLFENYK